ncbi:DUF402 domain-containing protein [Kitasatospora sp. NPDC001664]
MHLEPGTVVRWHFTYGGQTSVIVPLTVVRQSPEGLFLWVYGSSPAWRAVLPDGAHLRDLDPADRPEGGYPLEAGTWYSDGALIWHPNDQPHAVWWRWNLSGEFTGWYVNLEHRRWDGLDVVITDLELDLVVQPDGTPEFKDEESFVAKTGHPAYWSAELAAEVRAEGERLAKLAEARAWPFDGSLTGFQPPEEWHVPELPERAV